MNAIGEDRWTPAGRPTQRDVGVAGLGGLNSALPQRLLIYSDFDADYFVASQWIARKVTRMSGDASEGAWRDADGSGLRCVHAESGDTIEVLGERRAPWSELPSLQMRGRIGDLTLEFVLDRQPSFVEIGPRQNLSLNSFERVRYSQMTVASGVERRLASELDHGTWLRLDSFLMEALAALPHIRERSTLVEAMRKQFRTDRWIDRQLERVDGIHPIGLFYGGWRNGGWSEWLLQDSGATSAAAVDSRVWRGAGPYRSCATGKARARMGVFAGADAGDAASGYRRRPRVPWASVTA